MMITETVDLLWRPKEAPKTRRDEIVEKLFYNILDAYDQALSCSDLKRLMKALVNISIKELEEDIIKRDIVKRMEIKGTIYTSVDNGKTIVRLTP